MGGRLDFPKDSAALGIKFENAPVSPKGHIPGLRANIKFARGGMGNAEQCSAKFLFAQVLAVLVKPLQASVFTVGYIDKPVWADGNVMDQVELAGARTRLAPLLQFPE